jgi:hypothetical protein
LIQVLTRTRNNDSKVRTPRFDCFKFEFHSGASATFATISARKRHMRRRKEHHFDPLVGAGDDEAGNCQAERS